MDILAWSLIYGARPIALDFSPNCLSASLNITCFKQRQSMLGQFIDLNRFSRKKSDGVNTLKPGDEYMRKIEWFIASRNFKTKPLHKPVLN